MDKMRFKCEIITPLFLSGEDQNAVELRPPSIRGQLRWWFRALAGGIVGDNLALVKELETSILGDTSIASWITMRVVSRNSSHSRHKALPHKQPNEREVNTTFEGYDSGQSIEMILGLRPISQGQCPPGYMERFRVAVESAKLWLLLGGLGRRARRGFGSLAITESSQGQQKPLAEQITEQILSARTELGMLAKTLKSPLSFSDWNESLPAFPVIHHDHAKIAVAKESFPSWNELLEQTGLRMRNYKDPCFGGASPRQASPLIIRAHRLAPREYVPVFTLFKYELIRQGDWKKIEGFIGKFNPQFVEIPQ